MKSLQGGFEEGIERVAQSAKKNVKQQATATTQAVKSQVLPQKTDAGIDEVGTTGIQQTGVALSDQTAENLVKAANPKTQQGSQSQKQPSSFYQRQIAKGKTPEEAANIEKVRNELHKQYFEQLTNPPKPKVVVEEEQKRREMTVLEEEKEKKKLPPLPVQQKQRRVESLPGSG